MKKYRVRRARVLRGEVLAKEGEIVYPSRNYDYGLARDDSMATGVEHISVSQHPEGKYPFFTIPKRDLEEVE